MLGLWCGDSPISYVTSAISYEDSLKPSGNSGHFNSLRPVGFITYRLFLHLKIEIVENQWFSLYLTP